MVTIEELLQELEQETLTTRRVLERVPNNQLTWRPHEKARTLGELAMHVAIVPGVTLEDLLEEIVGEIDDEYDEEVRAQIVGDGESYLLDGMLAVRDLNRRFSLHLPEHAGYTTLAGFLMSQTGQVPVRGQSVEHQGARFTVERVEGRRIRRVRMIFVAAEDQVAAERRADGIMPIVFAAGASAFW